ncbi:MAG: nitroreductase family protein [Armatimonadota bacterium]
MSDAEFAIQVDLIRCTHCGACVRECPAARFAGLRDIAQVPRDHCLACGHCLAVCPANALTHSRWSPDAFRALSPPLSPPDAFALLQQRRSVRNFTGEPVADEEWQALLEALGTAPSGMNMRPVCAIIVTDPARITQIVDGTIAFYDALLRMLRSPVKRALLRLLVGKAVLGKLQKAIPELAGLIDRRRGGEDPIFYQAPGVMLLHTSHTAITGRDDCLLAAQNAMLMAPSLGLGTCMIGFVLPAFQREAKLRALVSLPAGHEIYTVLAVGHPAVKYHKAVPVTPVPATWQK